MGLFWEVYQLQLCIYSLRCWTILGLFKFSEACLTEPRRARADCSCLDISLQNQQQCASPPAKMNMVKRIMGRPRQEECSPQDNALGLMHLRRLFTELCHPPRHMTQKEQEEKLYMMLPVFNRVSPPG